MLPTIQGVPVVVGLKCDWGEWTLTDNRLVFQRQSGTSDWTDGRDVLDRFLNVKSESEILPFLNGLGSFYAPPLESNESGSPSLSTLDDFTDWQRIFRLLWKEKPLNWGYFFSDPDRPFAPFTTDKGGLEMGYGGLLDSLDFEKASAIINKVQFTMRFLWRLDGQHWALVETSDILGAILAEINVFHLSNSKIHFCELPDCGQSFELTSKHVRKYCTPNHAHLATIRRIRAKPVKKKKLKKTKKKKAQKKKI